MSKFNFTKFLKEFDSSIRWNTKINKYIKDNKARLQFNHSAKDGIYWCDYTTAITTAKSFNNIDETLKLNIVNELLERKILELKSSSLITPKTEKKDSVSLDSTHFNIYKIANIQELSNYIIADIKKSKPQDIKNVFKEYVYCFTYMYKFNTIKSHLTTIRGLIKNSDLEDDKKEIALKEFSLPNRIYDYINDGTTMKSDKNMTSVLEPIDLPFLNRFFLKAKKYLDYKIDKHNKGEVFSFLSSMIVLATGRRLEEVISQSTFEKISDYKIKVIGLAKKREDTPAILISPTLLASVDEILQAIAMIKDMIPKGIKAEKAKVKHGHDLAKQIEKYIDKRLWDKGDKFSLMRSIYAVSSELIYNQNNINEENRLPQATYMQKLLGHGDKDFTTYHHYYKRQALLRNFDISTYLETAKTAMM